MLYQLLKLLRVYKLSKAYFLVFSNQNKGQIIGLLGSVKGYFSDMYRQMLHLFVGCRLSCFVVWGCCKIFYRTAKPPWTRWSWTGEGGKWWRTKWETSRSWARASSTSCTSTWTRFWVRKRLNSNRLPTTFRPPSLLPRITLNILTQTPPTAEHNTRADALLI